MKTVTDFFEPYIGTKEYNGIVRTMIEWYYNGTFKKAAWCAISMSYALNILGLLKAIGEKEDNVYRLMKECEAAAKKGVGKFYYKEKIPKNYSVKRGTIIFMLRSDPPMTASSSKHVTSARKDFTYKGSGYFISLGGNQSDYIKESQYTQKSIYAIYEPQYVEDGPRDLSSGCKGDDVKELQRNLNKLGYKDGYGMALDVDGKFGSKTEAAVKNLQKANGLKVDGIVGKHTRAKIKELLSRTLIGKTVRPTTDLYLRIGAAKSYPIKKVLHPTKEYDDVVDKYADNGTWVHLKKFDGWVNKNYLAVV